MLNIILDPIFIYIMGVQGAALATVLSQLAASVWTFKFLTGKNTIIKIKLSAMRCQAKTRKKDTCFRAFGIYNVGDKQCGTDCV